MNVLHSFIAGSYRRSTLVAPLAECDIDICVVLHPDHYANRPEALLDKVRLVLLKTYPLSPRISRNGQAVTIVFSDFRVDVVPAFNRRGGGYIIPDSRNDRWIETDPKKHIEIWSQANREKGGNLVPLIKMIKAWNRTHSMLLRSFHLELLILHALNGVTISDFPSGIRFLFDKARDLVRYQIPDPAGYGDNVGGYIDSREKLEAICDRLEKAYDRALAAEQFAGQDRMAAAYAKWGSLFTGYFPAYK